jgi:AcrR family transcriptional regulator
MAGRSPNKQSTKGQKRAEHLMRIAVDLFAEKGYAAVTIQDITLHAGVTHSLVYYHFKNKEELFNRAVIYLIDNNIRSFQRNIDRHSQPVELLEDWFDYNIQHAEVLKKMVKIMFDCAMSDGKLPHASDVIKHFYDEEKNILSKNIAKGISMGIFKPLDPIDIAAFISTHIDGIFYGAWTQSEFNMEEAMNQMKSVLWSTIKVSNT